MDPADFVKYRKAAMGTAALSFVLAVSDIKTMNWGGVKLPEVWAWVFIAAAHIYFSVMMWSHHDLARSPIHNQNPEHGKYHFRTETRKKYGNLGLIVVPFALVSIGIINIALQFWMLFNR